jgi:hypothetical protein
MSGWKSWAIGEVVEADDFQTYIQNQTVQNYPSSASRGSALGTAVAEGMVTYLRDTNALEVYNGSSFVPIDTVTTTINASQVINTLTASTATAYTFASADQSGVFQFTAAGTVTTTVGTTTALTAGQRIDLVADGAAGVRITAGAGVTFAGAGTVASTFRVGQYQAATILCVSSNNYRIIGNITAV